MTTKFDCKTWNSPVEQVQEWFVEELQNLLTSCQTTEGNGLQVNLHDHSYLQASHGHCRRGAIDQSICPAWCKRHWCYNQVLVFYTRGPYFNPMKPLTLLHKCRRPCGFILCKANRHLFKCYHFFVCFYPFIWFVCFLVESLIPLIFFVFVVVFAELTMLWVTG